MVTKRHTFKLNWPKPKMILKNIWRIFNFQNLLIKQLFQTEQRRCRRFERFHLRRRWLRWKQSTMSFKRRSLRYRKRRLVTFLVCLPESKYLNKKSCNTIYNSIFNLTASIFYIFLNQDPGTWHVRTKIGSRRRSSRRTSLFGRRPWRPPRPEERWSLQSGHENLDLRQRHELLQKKRRNSRAQRIALCHRWRWWDEVKFETF